MFRINPIQGIDLGEAFGPVADAYALKKREERKRKEKKEDEDRAAKRDALRQIRLIKQGQLKSKADNYAKMAMDIAGAPNGAELAARYNQLSQDAYKEMESIWQSDQVDSANDQIEAIDNQEIPVGSATKIGGAEGRMSKVKDLFGDYAASKQIMANNKAYEDDTKKVYTRIMSEGDGVAIEKAKNLIGLNLDPVIKNEKAYEILKDNKIREEAAKIEDDNERERISISKQSATNIRNNREKTIGLAVNARVANNKASEERILNGYNSGFNEDTLPYLPNTSQITPEEVTERYNTRIAQEALDATEDDFDAADLKNFMGSNADKIMLGNLYNSGHFSIEDLSEKEQRLVKGFGALAQKESDKRDVFGTVYSDNDGNAYMYSKTGERVYVGDAKDVKKPPQPLSTVEAKELADFDSLIDLSTDLMGITKRLDYKGVGTVDGLRRDIREWVGMPDTDAEAIRNRAKTLFTAMYKLTGAAFTEKEAQRLEGGLLPQLSQSRESFEQTVKWFNDYFKMRRDNFKNALKGSNKDFSKYEKARIEQKLRNKYGKKIKITNKNRQPLQFVK